ncbi:DUF3017 domain-containing protein [Streptomyces sp. NPDC046203]|uniref:DUF3017 domain-containing protein n=1 Tax=Streptomyces sp. NPDC046203 TaxID=3154602 RepID=UPI0033E83EF7
MSAADGRAAVPGQPEGQRADLDATASETVVETAPETAVEASAGTALDAPAASAAPAAPVGPVGQADGADASDTGEGESDTDDAESGDADTPRRHPRATLTTGTVPPEGGGRAAPGGAPAPARQWPLLTVLGMAALGLLVVGTDLFPQAFRVGGLLIGAALLTGAVLRRSLPSVGMLAVRSRFTDMITYGVMGAMIVFLTLMAQPQPWLRIPFLEDVLHLTVT